ncbi:MAG: NADH-quinone oxidoreductase subunit NuoG [Caldithrix sp.]|nr:NADH-quinone oxidoreductase subunit NuoG [Caldithrix sp.]
MVTIHIDGTSYQVDEQQNLLEAILSLGLDLPYFCWHPAMGSVGACRQCAIKIYKDENDTQGKITMACMEPAKEGTYLSLNDAEAKEMRSHVIQWLMTNHPHDCPICDEGGECHLQDMTVMAGHAYRRHRYNKRTYRNQYLGPFINHEMNRCIQCYRCVRYYRDYAGGDDLDAFAAHNHVYFGRHEDGVLQNEFSGNLVEVCPTGVFTDKTLKSHYTRKWDLTTAPSICHHCSMGCNIIAGERYGSLRRIYARYNGKVNGYFICDRGRFGYEFVNSDKRIQQPMLRKERNADPEPTDKQTILRHIAERIQNNDRVIGIGSPIASLESNFALQQLVGENRFYGGISNSEDRLVKTVINILRQGPARTPSLKEIENADAILVLGEDLTNTAPMMALSLRQAVRNIQKKIAQKLNIPYWQDAAVREAAQEEYSPCYIATPAGTKLDEVARKSMRLAPVDIARLGFAVAHRISNDAPGVDNLSKELASLAAEIGESLKGAEHPLIVTGTSCRNENLLHASANIAAALKNAGAQPSISFTMHDANSMGLAMMNAGTLAQAKHEVQEGNADTVIILENDLYKRIDEDAATEFLDQCQHLIVLDYLHNKTTSKAEAVLPVSAFSETFGTLVNQEGRAQRFFEVHIPAEPVQAGWQWLKDLSTAAGKNAMSDWQNFHDFTRHLSNAMPQFKDIEAISPPPGYRVADQRIPRQSHRYSGRTAMHAHHNVHEKKTPQDKDSAFAFSMEGYRGQPPPSMIPLFWSPGWNSAQSINKYQIEVGGGLHGGDPGKRLIEPQEKADSPYFKNIPEPFEPGENRWLTLPGYHIFGSESLSMHTPGVAERAPGPYLSINDHDAAQLNIKDGADATYVVADRPYTLAVKINASLPRGVVELPAGLPGLPTAILPAWGKFSEASE